jgi:sugar lactone lactonase YvrE
MIRKLTIVLLLLAIVAPAAAQEVVVSGLVNPRGLTFDSDGNLYVVEAGNGGDFEVTGGRAPIPVGSTGKITRVSSEGDVEVIALGFGSQNPSDTRGASAILVTDTSIWVALGETPNALPFSMGLVELTRDTLRIKTFVDLYSVEEAENPDGDIVASNPVDFAVADDGTIYIIDASANSMYSWSPGTDAQIAAAWEIGESSPVPTSVDIGPDGDLYVGFLGGFPFESGQTKIERWSGGEVVETYSGLTAITDVLVTDDGTIYAVQYGVFGEGWGPGQVIRVTADGPETVLGDLVNPYALAMDAEGSLYVTVNSSSGSDGQVIKITM